MVKIKKAYSIFQPYLIVLMGALFYLYDFIQRVLPSAASPYLIVSWHISAQSLGVMAAMFFIGYSIMQVPSGLLLDSVGPRKLLTLSMFITTIFTFLFAISQNSAIANICRLICGLMMSFGYLGALVLVARWVSIQYFAVMVGLIQMLGSVGAIIGQQAFSKFIAAYDWRNAVNAVAVVGAILTLLLWLIIRDYPKNKAKAKLSFSKQFKRLWKLSKETCSNARTWWIALYAFFCWAPISIFGSFWGGNFLRSDYSISMLKAMGLLAWIWIGVAVGGPILGWVSKVTQKRKPMLILGSILGIISSCAIIYFHAPPYWFMAIALFLFGVGASAQAVTFGLISDINKPEIYGTASGINNMAIILGGVFLLPLVGSILDYNAMRLSHFLPHPHFHHRHLVVSYRYVSYRLALTILPICSFMGLIVSSVFVKETHCVKQFPIKIGL